MWIWIVMVDIKAHVLHGKGFHVFKSPLVAAAVIAVIALFTAASFYLNAVFAFAIAGKGTPEIRPAFAMAREHQRAILTWGLGIGSSPASPPSWWTAGVSSGSPSASASWLPSSCTPTWPFRRGSSASTPSSPVGTS